MSELFPTGDSLSLPTVQLLHQLPDGSDHVDWMIAVEMRATSPLVTFKLPYSLQKISPDHPITARRLADHRPAYLSYEGPVSGDRGTVRRIARGHLTRCQRFENQWHLTIAWETQTQHLVLTSREPGHWQIFLPT